MQLPGRESRFSEPPYTDLNRLVDAMADALRSELVPPFAFFGHSLGAWVAFELAHRLQQNGAPAPTHLFVSGRRAPHMPDRFPHLRTLPDEQFLAELSDRYDGIPAEIAKDRDLMGLLLPCTRADITMAETYAYSRRPKLTCSVSAVGGTDDGWTSRPELDAWREETSGPFLVDLLPGGHFFIQTARSGLLDLIKARLGKDLRRSRP